MKLGPGDRLSSQICDWLMRTYYKGQEWQHIARSIYLKSNGDSALSRSRVASVVRSHFANDIPKAEVVSRPTAGFEATIEVAVSPPKISNSSLAYVDWLFVADYLLLPCGSPSSEYENEVLRRQADHQQLMLSYELRCCVFAAREIIEDYPNRNESEIVQSIKETHPRASAVSVKEARRLIRDGIQMHPPVQPDPLVELRLYESLYF